MSILMKASLLIFCSLFSLSLCYAKDEVKAIGITFFAHAIYEMHDTDGNLIRVSPPVKEYKHLAAWAASEKSTSPDTVDLLVAVHNFLSSKKSNITIKYEIYEKVGPLLIDDEYGVTDLDKGLSLAKWLSSPSLVGSSDLESIKSGETKIVTVKDIPINKIIERRYASDAWPFFLKAKVSLSCDSCDGGRVIEESVEVVPGD